MIRVCILRPIETYNKYLDNMLGEGGFAYVSKGRELARRGYRVVNLSIGQPDSPTPDNVIDEAIRALKVEKFTKYTETKGIPELREAIADYLNERYGSNVNPDEVIVSPGAKGAIFLALTAYLRRGDKVIVPEPTYPAYSEIAKLMGAEPVFVSFRFNVRDGFYIDIEDIEKLIDDKTRMIIINNPHNPTGTLFDTKFLDELVEIARRKKILILADEIYDNFIYEGEFKSLLSYSDWRDWLLYVNGFSKVFSMTGWRMGYLIVDQRVSQALKNLAVNIWGCPVSFAQKAAAKGLKDPETWIWVKQLVDKYRRARDVLYDGLTKIPKIEVWRSKATFYMLPRVKRILEETGLTDEEFVNYIIENYYLILLPGSAFPAETSKFYVRFSFATSIEEVEEGVRRFREAVESLLSRSKK